MAASFLTVTGHTLLRDFILDKYQEDDETLRIDLHGVLSPENKTAIYVRKGITEDEFGEWDHSRILKRPAHDGPPQPPTGTRRTGEPAEEP